MVIGTSQHRSEGSHGSVPFKSPNSVKGRMLSTFLQWRYREIMWQSLITWLVSVNLLDSNPRLKFSLNIYNTHSKVIPSKPKKERRAWFRSSPGQETEIHDVKENLQVKEESEYSQGPQWVPSYSSLRLGTTLEIHFGCPLSSDRTSPSSSSHSWLMVFYRLFQSQRRGRESGRDAENAGGLSQFILNQTS